MSSTKLTRGKLRRLILEAMEEGSAANSPDAVLADVRTKLYNILMSFDRASFNTKPELAPFRQQTYDALMIIDDYSRQFDPVYVKGQQESRQMSLSDLHQMISEECADMEDEGDNWGEEEEEEEPDLDAEYSLPPPPARTRRRRDPPSKRDPPSNPLRDYPSSRSRRSGYGSRGQTAPTAPPEGFE